MPLVDANNLRDAIKGQLETATFDSSPPVDADANRLELARCFAEPIAAAVNGGGGLSPVFHDNITPTSVGGSTTLFSVAVAPNPASSMQLFRDGILQVQGIHYTIAGNQFTLTVAKHPDEVLRAFYRA